MKYISEIIALQDVALDLKSGEKFYDMQSIGLGAYFRDSILSDIESLYLYAGTHSKRYGLYRLISKRFPYAIYYTISESTAVIIAALDMRKNPKWIIKKIYKRKY